MIFNETKLASYFGRFQYKLMDEFCWPEQLDVMVLLILVRLSLGNFSAFGVGWVLSKKISSLMLKESIY
jgi:hypothetical protein